MNIELILSIVFICSTIATTILSIIFDKNTSKQDKIKQIIAMIPELITSIETQVGAKNGILKKRLALSDVRNECLKINLKWTSKLEKLFDEHIESVLTAPQKKINDEKEIIEIGN